jgi:hypothetical protein
MTLLIDVCCPVTDGGKEDEGAGLQGAGETMLKGRWEGKGIETQGSLRGMEKRGRGDCR